MPSEEKKDKRVKTEETVPEETQSKINLLHKLAEIDNRELAELIELISNRDPIKFEPESEELQKYLSIIGSVFGRHSAIQDLGATSSRDQLYQIYDEMDETVAYITAALDILSDDATQPDDLGRIITVESENSKVVTLLEDMIEDLEIEANISKWTRSVAKYGDLFLQVGAGDGTGITSLDDTIYPSDVERRDYRGNLLAFQDMDTESDEYLPPWKYIHFRHKGETRREKTNSRMGMVQGHRNSYRFVSSYGQSVLKSSIKVYSQLRFVENLILLSRLTNSVRRNIFMINTGNLDPASSFESVRNYASLLKKNINFDIDASIFDVNKHTATYDEDIFIPVSDTRNDVRIEQVGGDVNIAEQYDLEYLLNKLFAALKVPKAYLNYEQDLNARSTLVQLDIRYARSVSQLQNTMLSGLDRIARTHLAYLGLDPDSVDFTLRLSSVSSIDAESRLEQRTQRLNTARDTWDLLTNINNSLLDLREGEQSLSPGPSIGGGDFDFGDDDEELPLGEPEEGPDAEPDIPEPADIEPSPGGMDSYADFSSYKPRGGRTLTESLLPDDYPSSPLNMKYAAEMVLKDYLGLSQDDVDGLFRVEKDIEENVKPLREVRRYHRDLSSLYPTEEGMSEFEDTVRRLNEQNTPV